MATDNSITSLDDYDIKKSEKINTKTAEIGEIEEYIETIDKNADVALNLAKQTAGLTVTPQQDRKVLRKIDLYVTPLMCFLYAVQYMDKVTNSYAAIMGLRTDLNLVGDQYSWLGTGFYLGYLVCEPLSVRLLQRFPLIKTLSAFIIAWGICLTLNAVAFNFGSILAGRIFLGVLESAVSPAMMLLTAQYYKKEEQFARTVIWFSCNGAGNLIGPAIAYGIAKHQESINMEAWKVLFLVTGLLTIVVGIVFVIHLPDTPAGAWFLNEEEKMIIVERIRNNQQGFGNKLFKKYQFMEVFKDVRTYLFIVFAIASSIPNGGLGNFSSILIKESLHYSTLDSLLIGLPNGALQISSAVVCFVGVQYFHSPRAAMGIGCMSFSLIGACLLAFCKSKHAQLAGLYMTSYLAIGMVTCISMITSNTLGYTKKNTMSAIYFVAYCVGNTIGPQTFRASDAPNYMNARISMVACLAVSVLILMCIYASYWYDNYRRDKLLEKLGEDHWKAPENHEFLDLTDFENKNFRYIL